MKQLDFFTIDQKVKAWEKLIYEKWGRKLNLHVYPKIFDYFNNKVFTTEEEFNTLCTEVDRM